MRSSCCPLDAIFRIQEHDKGYANSISDQDTLVRVELYMCRVGDMIYRNRFDSGRASLLLLE